MTSGGIKDTQCSVIPSYQHEKNIVPWRYAMYTYLVLEKYILFV